MERKGVDTTKVHKRFFAKHARSSAMVVSLAIHAMLVVVALSLVAVSVVIKDDTTFEAKPTTRPKMNLRKLQIPVNIKKVPQQPKLRKQIVATPKINKTMPDIKMPEIVGVRGGLGSGGGGFGAAGSLGFSMPEIDLFGAKSKGERIFFALDASDEMMVDEIGGVRSYEIIKSELIKIIKQLNSAVVFNIVVYENYSAKMLFPDMVPANSANVNKAVGWLEPLNRFTQDKNSQQQYGSRTTGEGGIRIDSNNQIEPLKSNVSHWASPLMEAMKEQSDSVFVLTSGWGFLAYKTGDASDWGDANEARFQKKLAEAREKLKEENAQRAAAGDPPRIIPEINYDRNLVKAYFPDEALPPFDHYVEYAPLDLVKAFVNARTKNASAGAKPKLGLKKKGETEEFKINIIQFCKEDDGKNENFTKLTSLFHGEYRMIEGLKAVESYVTGSKN